MDVPLGNLDQHSLASLRQAFREAPEPSLDPLVGEHAGTFAGPWWLRSSAPMVMTAGRMRGWCGKRFEADGDGDGVLLGLTFGIPLAPPATPFLLRRSDSS